MTLAQNYHISHPPTSTLLIIKVLPETTIQQCQITTIVATTTTTLSIIKVVSETKILLWQIM